MFTLSEHEEKHKNKKKYIQTDGQKEMQNAMKFHYYIWKVSVTTKLKVRIYVGNLDLGYELWTQETNKLWHDIASLGTTHKVKLLSDKKQGLIHLTQWHVQKQTIICEFKLLTI